MLNDSVSNDILDSAMSQGADFAELFIEERTGKGVSLLNGRVMSATTSRRMGFGIRIMSGVKSVYVYTDDDDAEGLVKLASEAASALKSDSAAAVETVKSLCKSSMCDIVVDPMDKSKKDYVDYLRRASVYALSFDPLITQTMGSVAVSKRYAHVINTRGVNTADTTERIRLVVETVATKDGQKQSGRVAPGTMRGFEFLDEYPLIDKTRECCETAIRMVNAGYAPSGKMPVVINNGFGGVIFHEACGHALEATAVGIKSSCFTDMQGKQIASSVVSARDNARIEGEWGSYGTDDEGNTSSDLLLIENGILKNYMVDELGARRMGCKPTGCGRRQDYTFAPTSRMSNTYIENGNDNPADIIADTEYGLYAASMGGGSVDTATGEFNFAVDEGYMIRNGKIAEPVRGATLIGRGSEVLMNIDRVGNDLKHAAGMCGSVSGNIPVTVGQPTIRVSSILVGGRDDGEEV